MQCCNIYDSCSLFQDGFKYEQARLLEAKVMQQKYKVLSFAIVAALYIFLVPSTSHAQTHVPNTFAGDKACGGAAWTLGCDRIPLNGQPETREVCERLARTAYSIIQATGGYCYYYKDGTSSGRGGPNMWRYNSTPDTVAAQGNMGVCEPVERIRNMKDTARHSDYKKWVDRCQVSGSNGTCGNRAERPVGDGGRCEMTTAGMVAAQDVNPTHAPVNVADQNNSGAVCHPNDIITKRYNTKDHASYEKSVLKCAPEGVNADTCATGWGKSRCQWGIPTVLGPLNPAIVATSQAIADCKVAVAATFNDIRLCLNQVIYKYPKLDVWRGDINSCLATISKPARRAYEERGGKQGINCMKTSSTSPAVCARAAELVELGMCR